jgi:hypothetical protein
VLTKRLQKKPATIQYKALKSNPRTQTLTVFSDAGFKKEETDGYALRGAVYLRHFEPLYQGDGTPLAGVSCHMLRAESRSLKTVVRSTYAAELLSAAAAGDSLFNLTVTLNEVMYGPLGGERIKIFKDTGTLYGEDNPTQGGKTNMQNEICTALCIDARSVFESVRAKNFKPPAESSVAGHVLWIREQLQRKIIHNVVWVDTRDMLADGLTKGSVPRDSIDEAMLGFVKLTQTCAVVSCKTTK